MENRETDYQGKQLTLHCRARARTSKICFSSLRFESEPAWSVKHCIGSIHRFTAPLRQIDVDFEKLVLIPSNDELSGHSLFP